MHTLQITSLFPTPHSRRIVYVSERDDAGKNMELTPRPVDVPVTRPVGESYTGRDSQLDAAVRELLKQLGQSAAGGNGSSGSGRQ